MEKPSSGDAAVAMDLDLLECSFGCKLKLERASLDFLSIPKEKQTTCETLIRSMPDSVYGASIGQATCLSEGTRVVGKRSFGDDEHNKLLPVCYRETEEKGNTAAVKIKRFSSTEKLINESELSETPSRPNAIQEHLVESKLRQPTSRLAVLTSESNVRKFIYV